MPLVEVNLRVNGEAHALTLDTRTGLLVALRSRLRLTGSKKVCVDVDTGEVCVQRALGVFACGRIVNPKTARSQFIGGMTMGISTALPRGERHRLASATTSTTIWSPPTSP